MSVLITLETDLPLKIPGEVFRFRGRVSGCVQFSEIMQQSKKKKKRRKNA
jgi:hypothetical protein